MRTKALLKLFIAMLFALTMSVDAQAKTQRVYATVQTEGEILCEGPQEGYCPYYNVLKKGDKVQIRDISRYKSGWVKVVHVQSGRRGYIAVEHLSGNYIEEYKANTSKFKIVIRRVAAFAVDFHIGFRRCVDKLKAAFGSVFFFAKDRPALSWTFIAIALFLSILFIRWMGSIDKDLKKPGIFYIVYAVVIIAGWGFRWYSADHRYETSFPEKLMLFAMTLIPALIAINAAWHVRQCGIPDKNRRNDNFHFEISRFLLLNVWVMLTFSFWYNFLYPAIQWAGDLEFNEGTFWHFVLGLLIVTLGYGLVLLFWVNYLIPWFFKKAGNWTLITMTVIVSWGVAMFGYCCLHAYFKGFVFALLIFLCLPGFCGAIYNAMTDLLEIRCPRCHSCRGKQTGLVDLGISSSTSVSTRNTYDSDVTPENPNAIVSDSKEKVETTTYWHEWETWHKCPICDETWRVNHMESAGSSSRVVGRSHTETMIE